MQNAILNLKKAKSIYQIYKKLDVGQAMIIQNQLVLGLEAKNPGIILPDADFILPFELRDEENTHLAAFANVSYEEGDWKLD